MSGNQAATGAGRTRPPRHRATPSPCPVLPEAVDIFDTTLRDGSQQEGLSLTVDDKLRVAEQLDHLGVTFIEGGWPGANPKDEEFFARAPAELRLSTATLVAFGSTRRAGVRPEDDEVLRHLVKANTEAVCIVAKASEVHVTDALRTTLDEAVSMAAESVDLPPRTRAPGLLRRRALLRRLPGQSRVQPPGAPGGRGGGGGGPRALRHERRRHAPRRGADRGRHRLRLRVPGRRALPQRLGLCRGQLDRRRPGRAPPTSRAASTATASGRATPISRPPSPTCR